MGENMKNTKNMKMWKIDTTWKQINLLQHAKEKGYKLWPHRPRILEMYINKINFLFLWNS